MKTQEMPEDYVLVLRQIYEDKVDNFTNLVETLQFDPNRLTHIVKSLQHKGLVTVDRTRQSDVWLSLSSKGKHLMHYLWPESKFGYGY